MKLKRMNDPGQYPLLRSMLQQYQFDPAVFRDAVYGWVFEKKLEEVIIVLKNKQERPIQAHRNYFFSSVYYLGSVVSTTLFESSLAFIYQEGSATNRNPSCDTIKHYSPGDQFSAFSLEHNFGYWHGFRNLVDEPVALHISRALKLEPRNQIITPGVIRLTTC